MEQEGSPDAEQQLLEAQSRLRRISRSLRPASEREQARSWKRLRRSMETLRDLLGAWTLGEEKSSEPQSLRRRNELEARALRVESALRELEEKQGALDGDRERALSELERVQEGWRLLGENAPAAALADGSLAGLRSKISALTSSWERALALHAEGERERLAIDRIWRWILAVSLPTLEKRASGSDRSVFLPTLRRLLDDLDRRWKASYAGPSAQVPSDALAAAQDLIASREGRIAVLAKELEFLKGSLEETRRQSEHWMGACEQARAGARALEEELKRRENDLAGAEKRRQAAESGLSQAHEKAARLSEELEQSKSRRDEDLRWKEAQRERQRLSALLQEARAESESRRNALEETGRERAKLISLFNAGQDQLASLNSKAASLEKELLEHKAPLDREIARLKGDVEILQKALDGSRQAFDEAVSRASREKDAASARAAKLEEELLSAKSDLSALDQAHLLLSRKAEDLELERQRQTERERKLLEEEVILRNKAAEAEGRAADRDEEVARLNAAIADQAGRLKADFSEQSARLKTDFQEQSARLSAEMEALQARATELTREATQLRRQASQALGLAQARRAEVEKTKAEAQEADARAEAAASDAAEAREAEASVRAAADETSRKLQAALARIQASIDSTETAASAVAKAAAQAEERKAKEEAAQKEPPPDWAKVVSRLREHAAAAYGGLRKLAKDLPPAQRGLLRPLSGPLLETNDLLRLLSDFLDENAPQPSSVKAAALLAPLAAWKPAFAKRKIIVKRSVAKDLPAAFVEPGGLRLALNQAMRNAYDAMPGGGTLEVRLFYDEASRQLLFCLTDSGKGFSPESFKTLFKPFVSDKKGRLGLGLALARKLLRRWGGDAEAANVKGSGAQLTLRLPAEKTAETPPPPPKG